MICFAWLHDGRGLGVRRTSAALEFSGNGIRCVLCIEYDRGGTPYDRNRSDR